MTRAIIKLVSALLLEEINRTKETQWTKNASDSEPNMLQNEQHSVSCGCVCVCVCEDI